MKKIIKTPLLARLRSSLIALPLLILGSASSQAVTIGNLTTAGSSATIDGAIFQQIVQFPTSTGTGVINPFVQLNLGNATTVRGYNTTANNVFDNGNSDIFNHALTLGEVPVVTIGSANYRQFLLDINENNNAANDQFLSLDEIQIFTGGTANTNVTSFTGGILNHDGTLRYRLDTGMDNWVALNYALNTGSGTGDIFLYVPDLLFTGLAANTNVALYSQFGLQGTIGANSVTASNGSFLPAGIYGASDGFEEWSTLRPGSTAVPDGGATVALFGLALTGMGMLGKFRKKN